MEKIKRKFVYDGIILPDIPTLSTEQVVDHYALTYPELTNSTISDEQFDEKQNEMVYTIKAVNGNLG